MPPSPSASPSPRPSTTPSPSPTPVQGLQGRYYDNQDLTGLKLTRIDPTINFLWGTGSPDPRIGSNTFSARWVGEVRADRSETYTFYTTSNDGVRLWVNGRLLINNWTDHPATENSGRIPLQAGRWYPIVLEYYENVGAARISLSYSSRNTPKQIIPARNLRPDSTAPAVRRMTGTSATAAVPATANVTVTFSEPMNPASLTATSIALVETGISAHVPARVSYNWRTNTVILDPTADLKPGTTYRVAIKGGPNGAKDLAGNPLPADVVWTFRTGTRQ